MGRGGNELSRKVSGIGNHKEVVPGEKGRQKRNVECLPLVRFFRGANKM
jgi:hypothetical protein